MAQLSHFEERLRGYCVSKLQWLHSWLRQKRLAFSQNVTSSLLGGPNTPINRLKQCLILLGRLRYPGLRLLPIRKLADVTPLTIVAPSSDSLTWPPCTMLLGNKQASCHQERLPYCSKASAIALYHFPNAMASAHSNHFISGQELIMEEVNEIGAFDANYSTGYVINHHDQAALVSFSSKHQVKCHSAILLGGNGASNYYHWLIEVLPKLLWLQKQQATLPSDIQWVLPDEVMRIPSYRDSLACIDPELVKKALFISAKQVLVADNLYVLNSPNRLVFNLRKHVLRLDFFRYDNLSLGMLRRQILDSVMDKPTSSFSIPKRVFLARRQNLRRLYNQDEIEQLLHQYGFQPIYPETLSFSQQVQLFQKAEVIVGASGAAWSNLVFAHKSLVAISWLPERYMTFAAFSTLAHLNGCHMHFIPAKAHVPDFIHSSYRVDPLQLKYVLEQVL